MIKTTHVFILWEIQIKTLIRLNSNKIYLLFHKKEFLYKFQDGM